MSKFKSYLVALLIGALTSVEAAHYRSYPYYAATLIFVSPLVLPVLIFGQLGDLLVDYWTEVKSDLTTWANAFSRAAWLRGRSE